MALLTATFTLWDWLALKAGPFPWGCWPWVLRGPLSSISLGPSFPHPLLGELRRSLPLDTLPSLPDLLGHLPSVVRPDDPALRIRHLRP